MLCCMSTHLTPLAAPLLFLFLQEMAMRGYVGYLGPLPLEAVAPDAALNFAGHALSVPSGSAQEQVLGASKVCAA